MRRDIATPHLSDRPPQCHQHKNRQQMDGAENANNLRFMNKNPLIATNAINPVQM